MKIVEIENLKYTYPDGTVALKNLSIDIEKGKKVAILGSNGSGKSTLLQHFNGLIIPQEGSIKIKRINVEKESIHDIRKIVGLVFDNPDDQLFSTTVYDDIAFGPRNLKYNEEKVQEVVGNAIELVNIKDLKDKQPFNLSLGQKKKVAIAGVLAMEAEILVFDEPFSGLDPQSLEQFLSIMSTLHEIGSTIIVTTHDVDIAYDWADECIILNDGEVLDQGNISLLEDEELMFKANLRIPTLYKIFSNTNISVRNASQGQDLVTRLYYK